MSNKHLKYYLVNSALNRHLEQLLYVLGVGEIYLTDERSKC